MKFCTLPAVTTSKYVFEGGGLMKSYYIEPTSHAILEIMASHTDTIFPN